MSPEFWTFFQLALEIPFIGFSISVLVCILHQFVNNNSHFLTGFFVIYALQSAADIVTIVLVRKKRMLCSLSTYRASLVALVNFRWNII